MTLRSSVAYYMESIIITNSAVNETLRQHIIDLSTNKVWVGENAIVALRTTCKSRLIFFVAAGSAPPLVYLPTKVLPHCCPIRLAYYEPEHYQAVLNANNAQHCHQPSTTTACTLLDSQQPLFFNLPPMDNDVQLTQDFLK